MALQNHPFLLTVSEASELLRLSPNTLQNWLSQGRIKRVKIGRKTFVDRKEIEEFLDEALQGKKRFKLSSLSNR